MTQLIKKLIDVSGSEPPSLAWYIKDILSVFEGSEIFRQFIAHAFDANLSIEARRNFAEIIAESKGDIPIAVYLSLANSEDFIIRSQGILGLSRFDFEECKSIILGAIHPPSWDNSQGTDHMYAYVQKAAFEVLAKNKQLDLILLAENRPEYFYSLALDVLFDYISENQSLSFVPLLVDMLNRFQHTREQIKIAILLARTGEITRAQEAILNIFHNNQSEGVIYEVLKGIHFLPPQTAITIITEVVELTTKNNASSTYNLELCCEALELIGTSDATKVIILIIDRLKDTKEFSIRVERGFRALELLSPRDKEDWMIEMIIQNSEKMEVMSLRRGLETLGVIGGSKSLPILTSHFEKDEGELQVTCFWAIRQIYIREGILWYNNEEKMDNN